ncbi:site-specific integrase [Endozoicomonas acroporae]|uniref:site-specific integrase n=1 Tax=Endozoicomonas acroporae TaxID=1701104 RepID=UPI0013D34FF5|nr:site-specific integrase [Endozoicomonas acroporae]
MATIRKRLGKKGVSYQVIIRRKGQELTKTFTKKAQAEIWARQTEADIDRGEVRDSSSIKGETVARCIDRYIAEINPVKPIGRSKMAVLERIKRSAIANKPIANLRQEDIIEHCMLRKHQDGAEPSTISQDVHYLRGVIKTARGVWGYPLNSNPVEDAGEMLKSLKLVGKSKQRDRRPEKEELDKLKEQIAANKRMLLPMNDLIDFAIASAFRLGEICRITWGDLNAEASTVIIRDRKDPNQKIGNDQRVPLSDEALEIIARQPMEDERIFPHDARSVSTNFTRQCKKAGVIDLHFHDLRHEGTSRLFEQGLDIPRVAMITGHKDWSMLRRYTQLKPEDVFKK